MATQTVLFRGVLAVLQSHLCAVAEDVVETPLEIVSFGTVRGASLREARAVAEVPVEDTDISQATGKQCASMFVVL